MQTPILPMLGAALVNSWIVLGGLWFVFVVLVKLGWLSTPKAKHDVAIAMLSLGFLFFVFGIGNTSDPMLLPAVTFQSNNWLPAILWYWMGWLYLIALAFALLRLIVLSMREPLKPTMDQDLPVVWRHWVKQMSEQLGLPYIPRVWISETAKTPRLQGWLKAVIVLPIACLNQLSPHQCEALLLHELEHIRRNDLWWNRWLILVETCLYLNPFVHLFGKIIRQEREQACDDMVLQWKYNPHEYAQSLYWIAAGFPSQSAFQLAAGGNGRFQLLHRIERLMHPHTVRSTSYAPLRWLCLPLFFGFLQLQYQAPKKTSADSLFNSARMPLNKSFFSVAFQHDIRSRPVLTAPISPVKSAVGAALPTTIPMEIETPVTAPLENETTMVSEPDGSEEKSIYAQSVQQISAVPAYALPLQQLPEMNTSLVASGRPFIQNSSFLYHAVTGGDSTQVWLEKQRWELGLARMAELEDLMVWMAGQYKPGIEASGYLAVLQAEHYLKAKWQSLQGLDLPIDWYQTRGYETLSTRYRSTLLYLSALRLQYFQQESKQ